VAGGYLLLNIVLDFGCFLKKQRMRNMFDKRKSKKEDDSAFQQKQEIIDLLMESDGDFSLETDGEYTEVTVSNEQGQVYTLETDETSSGLGIMARFLRRCRGL
jgi:hypothetical protein